MNKYLGLLLLIFTSYLQAETHLKNEPEQRRPEQRQQVPENHIQKVEKLHARLIENMRANIDYTERASQLTPLVESNFDLETISRIALGRNWRKLAADKQRLIKDLMKELIVSNYAGRFNQYKNEVFSIQSDRPVSASRHLVRSTLTTGAGKIVAMDYHLTNKSGDWKIFDVIANGVSDLALKRSTYGASFKKSGLPGVIADIELNIKSNKS